MTTKAIVSMLHGRRFGKGKWMARCPVHGRDRSPSLSISEMGGGKTRLHCFAGCTQKSVLGALGLTWRDLTADKPFDREAYRAIEVERERQRSKEREHKAIYGALCNQVRFWEYQAGEAGRLMALNHPRSDELAVLFHEALRKVRILNWVLEPAFYPGHDLTETIVCRRRNSGIF